MFSSAVRASDRIGDPKVRRPGVKLDGEGLLVGTDGNLSSPFHMVLALV